MASLASVTESWALSFLLNSLWQIPLLLLVGHVTTSVLRRLGSAVEHRIWVIILILQTLLPTLSAASWNGLPAPWQWGGYAHRLDAPHVAVDIGPGIALSRMHIPSTLLLLIAVAYGVVTLYFLARFVWMAVRLAALRRHATPLQLTGETARTWQECRSAFEIGDVVLATSTQIFAPITLGLRRRLVLLPAGLLPSLSLEDMRTIIAHEFAHIRRHDFAKNVCYELLSIPVSFHPLAWLTRNRIMESREMTCDLMAAGVASSSHDYARSLLRLASLLVHGMPVRVPHAIGIFDAHTLERRIMSLKHNQNQVRGMRRFAALASCAVLLTATCATALSLHLHVDAAAAAIDDNAAMSAKPLTVSAKEMQGNKIGGPVPVYPVDAKKAGITGKVVLSAIISKDGKVEMLKVESGPKELQQSALDAVRQWTYKPFLVNGEATAVKTTVNVTYTLAR